MRLLQRGAREEWEYYARCKRAAILRDWIDGIPVDLIERSYSPNPYQGRIGYGDIRRFADATRFHLRSAHAIATLLFVERAPSEETVTQLLRRLEVGLPTDALFLLEMPIPLSRGECLTLRGRGVRAAEDLWRLATDEVVALLGRIRAAEIENARSVAAG